MKKIMLQAGHAGVTTGATGAPGEKELNLRIRTRLSEILISKGLQLFLVDANPPDSQLNQDFDLFLALHGDADYPNDGGSGFTDFPEPSTDAATAESQRLAKEIASEYFKNSGIKEVSHSNPNTRYYYMWARLSAKTPCVILEMGQVQDPHDKVILADTERVASAIARGVCKGLGVAFDPPPPPTPAPPTTDYQKKYNDEVVAHNATKESLKQEVIKNQELNAQILQIQNQLKISNDKRAKAIVDLA
jgi:N-acetylmuramoyl-L-alanine amidase